MMDGKGPGIRARRQERVAKVVWGSLFVVMGVLFTLHDMGRINLGEPVNDLSPEHAVDGNESTRWGSAFHDRQWLTVDLGASVPLSKVRLSWESAYAKDYELQISNDSFLWSTVRRVTGGQGGVEEQEVVRPRATSACSASSGPRRTASRSTSCRSSTRMAS